MSAVTIHDINDQASCRAIEELQAEIWGFEPRGVVPAHVLFTVGTSGGIVLAARDEGQLVGFVLGFLGRKDKHLCHVSHMLGVHPDFRGRGIGEALKRRQRERALEQGLDLMIWTFDPLEARNAHFNLHKLGAFSRIYRENLYGDLGDRLNRGLPTDRLLVEWELGLSPVVHEPSEPPPIPILLNRSGEPALELDRAYLGAPLSIAMPADIQHLKQSDAERAMAWRVALRRALTWAFAQGYVVSDVADGAYIATQLDLPRR